MGQHHRHSTISYRPFIHIMKVEANKPQTKRQIQVGLEVLAIAQDFFQRESSGSSMITVTRAEVSGDMKHGTIFITVLPESKEESAINFAKRMRSDLRHAIMKRMPVKVIPFLEVEIDYGEKNRLHISELLRKSGGTTAEASDLPK